MPIRINIADQRCMSGSMITGTVSLYGNNDIDVQDITIIMLARCKTKVTKRNGNSTSTYRGRAPLVYLKQKLFTGPHTLHPGHSWVSTLFALQPTFTRPPLFKPSIWYSHTWACFKLHASEGSLSAKIIAAFLFYPSHPMCRSKR